ncbi:MAG: hypothetical protein JSS07_06285 [Proteobacteria bacterium]|nr:hypothetical protein [Pseudomonadota bacterium]
MVTKKTTKPKVKATTKKGSKAHHRTASKKISKKPLSKKRKSKVEIKKLKENKAKPTTRKTVAKKRNTKSNIKKKALKIANDSVGKFKEQVVKLKKSKAIAMVNDIEIVKDLEKILARIEATLLKNKR